MPALTGTGRLADDLYLLAHDDVTGKPRLHQRALGTGLAGALLAELASARAVRLSAGRLVGTGCAAPGDQLAAQLLHSLLAEAEPYHSRDWLAVLAVTAAQRVARRLAAEGYLAPAPPRLWRARRWVPADSSCAFASLIRVRAALDPARAAGMAEVTLAGLAFACGLGSRLLPYGPPGARRHLDGAVRQLPPTLRELVVQTQAAVDAAVLSHRV